MKTPQPEVQPLLVDQQVEVIPDAGTTRLPPHKMPVTRPVLTEKQRRDLERAFTDPAEAAKTQFQGIPRDKNTEGRKRFSQPTRKDSTVMNTETTSQNASNGNVSPVPQQSNQGLIHEGQTLGQLTLRVVVPVAAAGTALMLLGLASRAIIKKFDLNVDVRAATPSV
jgi:hypothetical protein